MGHVTRMTLTGATGITFVFLVDAANLFWLAQLGEPQLVAAIGFAFAVQFFSVSSGVGLMIAAIALISRRIGQGQMGEAREVATACAVMAAGFQAVVALGIVMFRYELLGLVGAEGETARLAARYLLMTVPTLVIMVVGMIASGTLRADGDGRRAMFVTLTSGSVSMVVDPFLILWLQLGLDGAAYALILSRIVLVTMALRFAIGAHDLMAKPSTWAVRSAARPYFAVALPTILTQMSVPFGNYLLTSVVAGYGDQAVAGWAVVNRLTVVAFGGIFSLAGAIGGIFGQNFGAGNLDRVRATYRDAIVFCVIYSLAAWGLLVLSQPLVLDGFNLNGDGAMVFTAFTQIGAGAFIFSSAMYVSNAAFNTLDRPGWPTLVNWLRDGVLILPIAWWMAETFAAPGVIYAQALVGGSVGVLAAIWGWFYVRGLRPAILPVLDDTPSKP